MAPRAAAASAYMSALRSVAAGAGEETHGIVMVKRFVDLTASIRARAVGAAALAAAVVLLVAVPALVRRSPSLPIVYALPLAGIPDGMALDTGADRAIVSAYNVAAFSNGSGLGSVALYDLRTGRLVRALTAFSQNVEVTLDTPL